jgi:hypothetical protein
LKLPLLLLLPLLLKSPLLLLLPLLLPLPLPFCCHPSPKGGGSAVVFAVVFAVVLAVVSWPRLCLCF